MAMIRNPFELVARETLDVMGNSAYQPIGGEPLDLAGASPQFAFPQHSDGSTVVPFRLDQDPLDDDHYFLL
jgi:hypothetical protein